MAATDTRNNRRTVGSGVFFAVHAEAIQRGPAAMREGLETDVGVRWPPAGE
jgi:hypothetical protein